MAITLGTFTKQDNGTFTGTLKTLNVTAALTIVPVDKHSDNAPDHRVYAGQRYEVGAGWSQVAKTSGETYVNLKIAAPEFGPNWVRFRRRRSRGLGWNISKNTKGRDVSLLIKAVIAMARDIATAVDSAGLLPQAEEALAQVEE